MSGPIRSDSNCVADQLALRSLVGDPPPGAAKKEMLYLDEPCRRFLSLSTILFISTVGADGKADVSPRGDPAGFIKVLDERTIAIPDRPGNRRVDTMSNILGNPGSSVGLIFLVPGVDEVLRASGHIVVTNDPALLGEMAVGGRIPKLALVITLDELFFHCGKALKRARLWDPAMPIDRKIFPSYAELIYGQRGSGRTLEQIETSVADNYKNELY